MAETKLKPQAGSTGQFKIITASHDISATGDQAITGAGFTPKAYQVFFNIEATGSISWGAYDGTTAICTYQTATDGDFGNYLATYVCLVYTGGGVFARAAPVSLDSDGFTINWTKTGSPTGTLEIAAICYR